MVPASLKVLAEIPAFDGDVFPGYHFLSGARPFVVPAASHSVRLEVICNTPTTLGVS